MFATNTTTSQQEAVIEFQDALSTKFWDTLRLRLRGKPTQLLDFEQVRNQLRLREQHPVGVQEVPLNHIIGSVGRSSEFTRSFLPKREEMRDRWSRVFQLATTVAGLEPVELYKICEAYFVIDGNHRVSVAYRLHARAIEARVIEWESPVCLSPDTSPADLDAYAIQGAQDK